MERIPAHYLELVSDALLKIYWYKKSLRNTLRRSGVSESFLSTWSEDESKRDMLERLFPKLENSEKGILVVNRLADTLLEQMTFADLERLEDSQFRIKQAKDAIEVLRNYRQRQAETAQSERDRTQAQQRAREFQREVLKRHQPVGYFGRSVELALNRIGQTRCGLRVRGLVL